LQDHWHYKVAGKANFVNHCCQDHEVALNWKSTDELFDEIFKKSGTKLDAAENPIEETGENGNDDNLNSSNLLDEDEIGGEDPFVTDFGGLESGEIAPKTKRQKLSDAERYGLNPFLPRDDDFLGVKTAKFLSQ
jgi:hypothetical protein